MGSTVYLFVFFVFRVLVLVSFFVATGTIGVFALIGWAVASRLALHCALIKRGAIKLSFDRTRPGWRQLAVFQTAVNSVIAFFVPVLGSNDMNGVLLASPTFKCKFRSIPALTNLALHIVEDCIILVLFVRPMYVRGDYGFSIIGIEETESSLITIFVTPPLVLCPILFLFMLYNCYEKRARDLGRSNDAAKLKGDSNSSASTGVKSAALPSPKNRRHNAEHNARSSNHHHHAEEKSSSSDSKHASAEAKAELGGIELSTSQQIGAAPKLLPRALSSDSGEAMALPTPKLSAPSETAPKHTAPLPLGWRTATSSEGVPYFYHEGSGETTWSRPS